MLGRLDATRREATVVGAGIAGLLAAYALDRKGYRVTLLEAQARAGGLISTQQTEYGIAERAAHSLLPADPVSASNPIDLPPRTLAGKRMRFYASDRDPLVPTARNTDAFRNRFASVADISVVPCTGGHLDPSCVQPEDILKWFNAY